MARKKTVDTGFVDCTEQNHGDIGALETPRERLEARVVREQVGGE